MLTAEFLHSVEPLYDPCMGTKYMAPLLYSLVRSTRPKRLLEVGAGYTTPFLVKAAHDNAADFLCEKARLAQDAKSELLLKDPYDREYRPVLTVIDDLSHPCSRAKSVRAIVDGLQMSESMHWHAGDFRGQAKKLIGQQQDFFDFVWLIAENTLNTGTL